MERFLLVAVGGAAGSVARYAVALWVMGRWPAYFPVATVFVNVTGSFLIGLALAWLATRGGIDPRPGLLVATGFLGGYTTFSTFTFETYTLASQGHGLAALANVVVSLAAGYLAVCVGVLSGQALAKW